MLARETFPFLFHVPDLSRDPSRDLQPLEMMAEMCPACSCFLSFFRDLFLLPGLQPLKRMDENCLALDRMALACSCSQVAALAFSSEEQLPVPSLTQGSPRLPQ